MAGRNPGTVFAIIMLALTCLPTIPLVIVFGFIYPPPGEPVASVEITPGEPFSMHYTSDGSTLRAFVDLECWGCGTGLLEGRIEIRDGDGNVLMREDVDRDSDGYSRYHHEGGGYDAFEAHLMFTMPETPAGTEVHVTGTLEAQRPKVITVWPPEKVDLTAKEASRPRLEGLKLWVAH